MKIFENWRVYSLLVYCHDVTSWIHKCYVSEIPEKSILKKYLFSFLIAIVTVKFYLTKQWLLSQINFWAKLNFYDFIFRLVVCS